jgi:hypothetical protein
MGRLQAQSVSLQNLPREFRAAIGAKYHDIDMVYCHSSILLPYCKANDIQSDALEYYVNHSDEFFEKIMSGYSLDKGILSNYFELMNGSTLNGVLDPFFTNSKRNGSKFLHLLSPKIQKCLKMHV